MRAVAEEVRELVLEYGGVNSSEHGDGLARSEFNRRVFGDALYAAMQETKRLFDPENRMNPGKIVDAPAMTDHLRDVAQPPAPPLTTRLRFDAPGGMRGAADRCMNIGLCRKTSTGVMCPSYMATRDEEHSTRGRANALVNALSMPDPRAALGDERLHGILDLCLECKACKSECPLGVDMAALKTEALAAYHDQHGVPLRSRMFGSIRTLNRLGSAAFPLSNLAAGGGPPGCWPSAGWGSAPPGRCPGSSGRTCAAGSGGGAAPAGPASQGELIFLADSFTTFTEPVGRAGGHRAAGARRVAGPVRGRGLLRPGQPVQGAGGSGPADGGGHGRAPGRGGRPRRADRRGGAVVPADPARRVPGPAARRPESAGRGRRHPAAGGTARWRPSPRAGSSCRRTTRSAAAASCSTATATRRRWRVRPRPMALLRSIPGADVVEVDAGCCGMAGSFGFEAEHYELSMSIGELRLFPAIRAEAEDDDHRGDRRFLPAADSARDRAAGPASAGIGPSGRGGAVPSLAWLNPEPAREAARPAGQRAQPEHSLYRAAYRCLPSSSRGQASELSGTEETQRV